MTRVLVVWEDDHWKPLGAFAKQMVRALAPAPDAEIPTVLGHTTRSNGAFTRYVRDTWRKARPAGLPEDGGAIDHLICVVDADRLHELFPAHIPRPPPEAGAIAAWHVAAERVWHAHLRAQCEPGGPPTSTVHGIALRWAKESLLLAGYDQPAMEAHLDISAEHPGVVDALDRCAPRPRQVDAARFTDTYRHPFKCVNLLRDARKLAPLHKSAPEIDDTLRTLARQSLTTIRDRVPDVARLAALVWRLHHGTPEPTAAPVDAERRPGKKAGRAKR
jgi:hypothetical protein